MATAPGALTITVTTRVRGMWRVVLLGWAIRLFRLRPQHVDVEFHTEGP